MQSHSDQATTVLQTVTKSWLQRRGHLAPPGKQTCQNPLMHSSFTFSFLCTSKLSPADAGFLTKQQKQDFQDCFLLLDTEKTGRLNVDNLTSAFQLLNIEVRVSAPYSSRVAKTLPHCCIPQLSPLSLYAADRCAAQTQG